MSVQEQIDTALDWMTEPCSCGDYLSHPDGGDSQCAYCSGATKLRNTLQSLHDQNIKLRAALEEISSDDPCPARNIAREALNDD